MIAMAKAFVIKPYCIDEYCLINGKNVKKILSDSEPVWINEVKAAASLIGLASLITLLNFAWYFASN